jgi:hypothetical protein
MEVMNIQIKRELENSNYYRISELLEYHYSEKDVQEFVQEVTGTNQVGNSKRASFNSLMDHLMKGGNL